VQHLEAQSIWKDKYPISWCHLCDVAIATCPECYNSSCKGSGCEECEEPFSEFLKCKIDPEQYLSSAERETYRKISELRNFILKTLGKGQTQVNWQQLLQEGQLSSHDKILFAHQIRTKRWFQKFKNKLLFILIILLIPSGCASTPYGEVFFSAICAILLTTTSWLALGIYR
jgi:hypothetical protein